MQNEPKNKQYIDRRVGNLLLYRGDLRGYENAIGEIVEVLPTKDEVGGYRLKVKNLMNESEVIFAHGNDVRDITLHDRLLEKIGFRKREGINVYECYSGGKQLNMINTFTIEHADDTAVDHEHQGWLVVVHGIDNPIHTEQLKSRTMPLPTLHALQNYMSDKYDWSLDIELLTNRR